jgi:hypothetical protein
MSHPAKGGFFCLFDLPLINVFDYQKIILNYMNFL